MTVTFNGLGSTQNENYQRYMINARINQKIKGYAGAEVGLTFNRLFDFDQEQNSNSSQFSQVFQQPIQGYGAVSDTVLGVDFQAPFGGAKESSYGPREQGMAARAFYTESRTVLLVP